MIHRSPYPDPHVPDQDLVEFVLERTGERGRRPALVDGITGETVAYADLPAVVGGARAALGRRGVRAGDAVALLAPNQPRWAIAFYGILAAGGAVVPLNPAFTTGELTKLLRLAGATALVADEGCLATARSAAEGLGIPVLELRDLTSASSLEALPATPRREPQHPAVIAFSSGTTGQPKGVVLTHRNLVSAIVQHEGIYHVGPDDRFLAALPLFHIYGLSMILDTGIRQGATIVTLPRFELRRYLELVAEYGVTWLHLVPPVALQLLSEAAAGADLSSVRHAVSGAAPLDAQVATRAERRLGVPVGQGYGMTEASPGVTWVPDDGSVDCPPGSVGVLVAGTEARLVDPATGTDTGGEGELWVRGPQVMAGYLDDAAATAATVVEDGWLRTGDIARVDDGGVWWIVDRLKELIKYKGYQVAPAELEAVLLEHPAVADAAVAGLPDPEAGEIPKAWVVATGAVDTAELLAWVAQRVAPYKRIRAIELVPAIPRSPSGKILRRQLRADGGAAALPG